MKHLLLRFLVACTLCIAAPAAWAQAPCSLSDIATIPRVAPSDFPYTSPTSGITTSVRLVGISTIGNTTYSCSGISYACSPNSWWLGDAGGTTDSIILTFSMPVSNFSVVVNGSNSGEEFTFSAATGTITLSNYCSAGFATVTGADNKLSCITSSSDGAAMITINNSVAVTQYVITHNGAGSGSRITLLDCTSSKQGPAGVVNNIELWLDGSDVNFTGTNPADSTPLAIWKDVSGNYNDAYVLSGLDTPMFRTSKINGKDIVRFKKRSISSAYGTVYNVPGTDIRADSMPQTTIFTVYRPSTHPVSDLQGLWGNDDGGWDRFFMPAYSGINGIVSVGPPINSVTVTGSGIIDSVRLLTAVYDHGKTDSSTIYFNAIPVTTVTDNTDPTAAQSTLRIGWDGDNNPYDGDIAEMVVYKRKLSECEIKAVNRYFGYKYGVNLTTALVTPSTLQYICSGSTVALKASKGDAFQWLKNGAPIASATDSIYNAAATGNYSVIVTKSGCSDTSLATPVTLVPSVIYVDSSKAVSASGASWDSAKRTVTEALFLAHQVSCPVQVWVKKGTYYPTSTTARDSSFRISRNNIRLYGGFAGTETLLSARSVSTNPTILSGNIGAAVDSTDNSYHVMTIFAKAATQIDTNTIVDGFTITSGNAQFGGSFTYNGITYNRQDGGGIHTWGAGSGNKCSPLIANCTFTRNSANYGGGIYNAGFNAGIASPVLRNNTFSNNKANTYGGGVFNNGQNTGNSSPVTTGCTFTGNTAGYGGGMYNQATGSGVSTGTITNCTFSSNTAGTNGGGIALAYSSPLISNCTFTGNFASYSGGGFFQEGGISTFTNNLFDQNTSSIGGAIRIYQGNPSIVLNKNVFVRNIATGNDGGAMSVVSGTGKDTIINNLFVYNKGTGSGPNGGGAFVQENGTGTYIVNNTFYADSSTGSGGAVHFKDNGSNRYLYNNIFYKSYNGSAKTDYNTASGATITAAGNNLLSTTDPLFVNEFLPLGADNIWRTADDGLRLYPCSPAVDSGLNSAVASVTDDIAGAARIQFTLVDRGAYEHNFAGTGKPRISITANPGNKICQGTMVTFPVTKTNGGTVPQYRWYKNGVVVSTADTFSSNTLEHKDSIWVVLINSDCNLNDTSAKIIMSVTPPVVYVDSAIAVSGTGSSWIKAVKTVTEALTIAHATPESCPVQIWVKKGTYYPTAGNRRDSSFRVLRNNIKIYGGFAGTETLLSARSAATNLTVLSGDIGIAGDSTDNSYHIMTIVAASGALIDTNTVVDGFTITKGNANGASISFTVNGQSFFHHDGAGIYNIGYGSGSECSPKINNCNFTRNSSYFGSAMYNGGSTNGKSSPVVTNSVFEYNFASAASGACLNQARFGGLSNPSFTNCIFRNNGSNGEGGVFYNNGSSSGSSSPSFTNCQFTSNYSGANGGAVFSVGSTGLTNNPSFKGCTFTNNTTNFGTATVTRGGALYNATVTGMSITDCIFTGNITRSGGGAIANADASTVTITRSVFTANAAVNTTTGAGGAVQHVNNSSTTTTATNCLFVNNSAGGTSDDGGGAIANTAGTINLLNCTAFGNTTASTTRATANTFSSASGSTTNLTNTIIWGSAASHMDMLGTVNYSYSLVKGAALSSPSLSTDPRFVNPASPIGADGIWLTADDGLELLPCSPAVNAATTAPALDIRNRSRLGLPDMGAYEEQTGILPAAPVAVTPIVYCQNVTPTVLTATKTSATDTLKWYNAVPALLPGAPTPVTTDTGTFTYYVSQTNIAGCESSKKTITVRVNTTPLIPVTTTPVIYCQNATAVALSATKGATADTLRWYDAVPALLSGAPTPVTTATGNTTYYVSSKNNFGCEGPKKTIVVTVNPTPVAPTSTSPVVYCQNATATALTATKGAAADTLKWYDAVPAALSGAPTPQTTTTGSTTYYVSGKNNFGCEGPKKTIVVTVNPTPLAPVATTPVTYCQDDVPAALTATKASGTDTLKWYDAVPASLAATPVPGTATPGSTVYYVSGKTSLGCEGSKTKITVTVNPKPLAPVVVTPVDLCFGVTAVPLSATGINLKWYTVSSGGTSTTSITPPVSSVGSTTYYVSQTTTLGCEGPRSALTVNVRPSPTVTIAPYAAPAFVYCHDDSITIKATSATATSYQWRRNTINMPGSVATTITVKTTADYSVIVKDMYGCADTESVHVIENPLPVPTLSPTNVNICPGVSIMLYANPATPGYVYQWTRYGVPMSVPTTTDHTPVTDPGLYAIKVTDIYNCVLTTNTSLVNLYPAITIPVIERSGTMLRTKTSYATYQWYRNGKLIAGAVSRNYIMAFDGDYSVIVTDENGCTATSDIFTAAGLGIDIQLGGHDIKLFPNPTQALVNIEADIPVNVSVTDVTGRLILEQKQATTVNLQSFADGMYLFTITDKDGLPVLTQKVHKVTR